MLKEALFHIYFISCLMRGRLRPIPTHEKPSRPIETVATKDTETRVSKLTILC